MFNTSCCAVMCECVCRPAMSHQLHIAAAMVCGVVGKAMGQSRLFYLLPHLDVIRDGGISGG